MSNGKQDNQGRDWVVPIAIAVIGLIGTISVALINKWNRSSSPERSTNGEFKVYADKPGGTNFINQYNSHKKYRFVANGKWTYNNTTPGVGMHGPDGHPSYPSAPSHNSSGVKGYYLPGKPEGSLIVHREDNSYNFVGNDTTLELKPKESVFFTINDTNDSKSGKSYLDNDGYVTVEWQLRK